MGLDKNGKKLSPGSPVKIIVKGKTETGVFKKSNESGNLLYIKVGKKGYYRPSAKVTLLTAKTVGGVSSKEEVENTTTQLIENTDEISVSFDIHERFDFLESLVRMVIDGNLISLIITGQGGIGKTYTVKQQFEEKGLVKPDDYWIVKGYSTAKGLYNTLYEHNGKIIIFDDCDEVLKNDISRNVLKGALDSYDERYVSWAKSEKGGFSENDTPQEFLFTGKVIFISNLPRKKMDQALMTRTASIDLTLTLQERMDRMHSILPYIRPEMDMSIKEEAYRVINSMKHSIKDVNFRTLDKAISVMASGEENKDKLLKFLLVS